MLTRNIRCLLPIVVLIVIGFFLNSSMSVKADEQTNEATYVGVQKCKMCHKAIYESWAATKHASIFDRLKQEDLSKEECIMCHVTGYGKPGGYNKDDSENTENFKNVQCEVCHGPGSLHMKAAKDKKKETITRMPTEELCLGCHNKKSPQFKEFIYKDRIEKVNHK